MLDVDGDLLGFINPSLTLFSADEEAVTSCDVTSEMTLTDDDVVDVTLLDENELRIKTEPVEMYDVACDDTAATLAARQSGKTPATYDQYTPPTPTRLNYPESRRRCVLNLQLVHGGFCRKIENRARFEFIQSVGCRIGNWVTTADG